MSKETLVDNDVYALSAEFNLQAMFLHLDYKKDSFRKKDYIQMLHEWEIITTTLKEKDIKEVFSCVPLEDSKVQRWQTMFGLCPFLLADDVIIYRSAL